MRILSGVDNLTYLFCDLVEIGLDFFELLRIYCDNDFLPYFGDPSAVMLPRESAWATSKGDSLFATPDSHFRGGPMESQKSF